MDTATCVSVCERHEDTMSTCAHMMLKNYVPYVSYHADQYFHFNYDQYQSSAIRPPTGNA